MTDIVERLRYGANCPVSGPSDELANDMKEAADEIERLRAENAELRADAERYHWIRSRAHKLDAHDVFGAGCGWRMGFVSRDSGLAFDAAIEAAMKEQK